MSEFKSKYGKKINNLFGAESDDDSDDSESKWFERIKKPVKKANNILRKKKMDADDEKAESEHEHSHETPETGKFHEKLVKNKSVASSSRNFQSSDEMEVDTDEVNNIFLLYTKCGYLKSYLKLVN